MTLFSFFHFHILVFHFHIFDFWFLILQEDVDVELTLNSCGRFWCSILIFYVVGDDLRVEGQGGDRLDLILRSAVRSELSTEWALSFPHKLPNTRGVLYPLLFSSLSLIRIPVLPLCTVSHVLEWTNSTDRFPSRWVRMLYLLFVICCT